VDWTKKWCLQLNIDKCKVLRVAYSGCIEYKLDGVPLQEVQQEKDLGIEVASDLKPSHSQQCAAAVSKAMQVLGIIRKKLCFD